MQNLLILSHYFPQLLSFQADFRNVGIRLIKLGLLSCQFKKILKIWFMIIPVFALNKGSSLYQEADFETHFSGTSPDTPLYLEPQDQKDKNEQKKKDIQGWVFGGTPPLYFCREGSLTYFSLKENSWIRPCEELSLFICRVNQIKHKAAVIVLNQCLLSLIAAWCFIPLFWSIKGVLHP